MALVEEPFEEGACVHTRRRMRLEIDEVGAVAMALGLEEVLEADLEQVRCRGVGRDVAALLAALAVGAHDHDHGVPADRG